MQFTLKPTPEELVEMIKKLHKDMPKEDLIKMLVRTGMYNEDGTLKEEFK